LTAGEGQKYASPAHFAVNNDKIIGKNRVLASQLVNCNKNPGYCGILKTLDMVKMNKLLSNPEISLACYRG